MIIKNGDDILSVGLGIAALNTGGVTKSVSVSLLEEAMIATKKDLPPKPMTLANKAEFDRCLIAHVKRLVKRREQ